MSEVLSQGPREARDHAVIGGEAQASAHIAARKCDNPGHARVVHERGIEIREFRDRQLEHHLAAIRQGVELPGQFREKDGFGAGLVRALDRDFRLDDARTILDEVLRVRPDYIEHQLAHAVRDPNGRAYNRTAHLPERRRMMQQWADYLDMLKAGPELIPLHGHMA
jgi:hypothetical protein